jgi:hypothetical protein
MIKIKLCKLDMPIRAIVNNIGTPACKLAKWMKEQFQKQN